MFSYSTTSGDSTNLGTVRNMWECKLKKVPESRVLQIHTHTHWFIDLFVLTTAPCRLQGVTD